jgi:hypothetical protein
MALETASREEDLAAAVYYWARRKRQFPVSSIFIPSFLEYPAVTYQRAGVGTVNAEERDRRLRIDLCGLGETPRGDGLEARRGGAGAASGDTAGEHIGGGVGGRSGW